MGNPQFVPAGWPVVIRSSLAGSVTLKNENGSGYATRHYVNMYLPNAEPLEGLDKAREQIILRGEYLERTLDDSYMQTKEGVGDYTLTGKTIMVFGLPFVDHAVGSADENVAHHEYARDSKQVGWYTNDNWARENAPTKKAHKGSYPDIGDGTLVATDASERSNFYVYHNKVYYPYTKQGSGSKQLHIIALFDDVEPAEPEDPESRQVTDSTPWPCDVFDLQGRRVAKNETPETLRRNNPGLPKGVYIFGHKKVTIK